MISKERQVLAFINGGGEMGKLIRTKDWSNSILGTPDTWPQSLRTAVSIILNSRFPMFVWWGEDLITIYNDAYCPIAGEKHPKLLGRSGREGWAEIWNDLEPLVTKVFSGTSTWSEDQVLYMNRYGYVEETYFTFSYSPVLDDSGKVNGLFCACIETTEKVLGARKIQESERNLRNTILQSPVAMCILRGPSFVVEVANSRMYEIWGRPQDEVLHRPIFDGLPEVRHQGLEQILQNVYKTGDAFVANERLVMLLRKGKIEPTYINFVYEPFRTGDGSVTGIIAVATEVTEQVFSRQKIEEQREELKLALQIAELGTFQVDTNSRIGSYSDRIMDWFGFTQNQQHLDTVFSYIHEDDRPQVIATIERSLLSEENSRHDITYRVRNNSTQSERYLRSIGKALFEREGKAYQIRGVIQDVTTQIAYQQKIQESEAKLQQRVKERTAELETQKNLLDNILNNSSNGISVTEMIRDENGIVIDARTILANEAAVRNTGLDRKVYLTKTARELDPNILLSPYEQTCLKTLETGNPSLIQYCLELTGRWLELTISKMDDDHLIHIFTDVTPIKETQLQLERLVEELKRSNANLEEFAYAASHDMKEPIRKIHFFADRLKSELEKQLNENQKHLFQRLEHSTKRMSSLIDDLLTYSHVSKGIAHLETVNLNVKVENVLEDLELEIEEKKARINVQPLPTIEGHKRQIQQLFQNLISNALKYSKPGVAPEIYISASLVRGRELNIDLPPADANKTYQLVQVRDNGIGFDQKDAERIFNVFTRLHSSPEYRGTGVGLSIARKVMENHKGYIRAQSKPGQGTTFMMLFPSE